MSRVPHRDSPAPWKVYPAASGALMGVGDKSARGVTDYQGGFWGSGANKRANMYLVAAAPELYEAAQVAMTAIRPLADQGEDRIWRAAVKAMDALSVACAKARGEQ